MMRECDDPLKLWVGVCISRVVGRGALACFCPFFCCVGGVGQDFLRSPCPTFWAALLLDMSSRQKPAADLWRDMRQAFAGSPGSPSRFNHGLDHGLISDWACKDFWAHR